MLPRLEGPANASGRDLVQLPPVDDISIAERIDQEPHSSTNITVRSRRPPPAMRCSAFHLLPASLLVSVATSLQLPDLQPFLSALPNVLQDYIPQNLQNSTAHDLLKRQSSNTCPDGFDSCANLGAAQLCCMSGSVCSADYAGAVACCPSGAACTGTISGIITQGTIDASNGGVVGGGGVVTGTTNSGGIATASASTTSFSFYSSGASTTSNNGLVMATSQATIATDDSGTSGNGFIVDGTSTVATPGAGVRRAEIPFIAKVVIRALEYLPM